MRPPHVDDRVRLTRDVPELSLKCGEVGVVRSIWCSPSTAYEVEFELPQLSYATRALLMAEQVRVEERPTLGALRLLRCSARLVARCALRDC